MSSIKEQFLGTAVPKNSYILSGKDVGWIYGNLDVPVRDFIFELLKCKFNNTKRRFNTDEKLALACHEIIKRAKYEFEKHPHDKLLWVKFRQGRRALPEKILFAYRQLWRGYSETEVKHISRNIWKDRSILDNALDKACTRNSVLYRHANKMCNKYRKNAYIKNKANLDEIKQKIEVAFSQDSEVIARIKLSDRTYRRRHYTPPSIFPDEDYFRIKLLINIYNPELINFPLRFMGYLPARTYELLSLLWLKKCSRDQLMLAFVNIEGNSISDVCSWLLEADNALSKDLGCQRSIAFKEISEVYEAGNYIAATLLAITQTEGVLWDFARYLNRRNIRIFKSGFPPGIYWPYLWNRDENKYRNINQKTKRPLFSKKGRLLGAGSLLEKTRIGSIISPRLISYLLDDFIQDRNPLAHGKLENRDYKPTAISAIHCLRACLYDIAQYLVR